MTARQLLETLRTQKVAVSVEGLILKCRSTIPEELKAPLRVLHTGMRAVLTGRQWLGLNGTGHTIELSTEQVIPAEINYLCCLGDGSIGGQWLKISRNDRRECEKLFAGSEVEAIKQTQWEEPTAAEDTTAA
ncbi:hypothetical protein J8F10_37430 [Gemmata sp. G18]|uniref:Uncharacterized protein n=1 Tax=Gemmata palustris TaxID=2822762 RepID=A0ABS5C4M2_9BACT|nr:hypothetical protein [Gemmata palustris]MBP3960938.1 hypothetical protein [Gemmata palustris]